MEKNQAVVKEVEDNICRPSKAIRCPLRLHEQDSHTKSIQCVHECLDIQSESATKSRLETLLTWVPMYLALN
jgi:hypothetical protein